MIKIQLSKSLITLVFLAFTTANASAVTTASANGGGQNFGNYIGTFVGPDNEAWFDNALDLEVEFAGTLSSPATTEGFITIFDFVLNDDGAIIGGQWAYTGPDTIRFLALTAGPLFALYEFTDGTNTGYFNMAELVNKPFDSLSLYAVTVPLPAAVWLLLTGCITLVGLGKRRS